jgi:uncharacterized protein YndB with AHSA1/START domain
MINRTVALICQHVRIINAFQTLLQMNKQLIVNKERAVAASAEEVWEIITSPGYFDKWMFVPGRVQDGQPFKIGSVIQWINDKNIVYLEGEVIELVPQRKLVIALHDTSWIKPVPKGSVTYEFHLKEEDNGTKIRFHLGDLSVDPEGQSWYDAYNSSDEIGEIEKLILANR